MRKVALIAGVLAFTSIPAFAQSMGEKSGINSVLGIAPKTADFVMEAATSDMFEIESSKLAAEKGGDKVKTFASQMVADHTKTSSELRSKAQGANVQLPTAMTSAQQSKLDKLRGLSGQDFDAQYSSDQVSAHKDAVSLFERYGKGGDNEPLKSWAVSTLPSLQHHLDMAQQLPK
jgi:putative membrane protein